LRTQGLATAGLRYITGARPFGVFPRAAAFTGPYAAPHQNGNMLTHAAGRRGRLPLRPQGLAAAGLRYITGARPFGERNLYQ
jgi:hypothetical protein